MNSNKLQAQTTKVGIQALSALDKLAAPGTAYETPKASIGELEMLV